jgi:hypothetical protein
MTSMTSPSADSESQSFSSFASLNRADQTHAPRAPSRSKERVIGLVLAGLVAVLAICLIIGTR